MDKTRNPEWYLRYAVHKSWSGCPHDWCDLCQEASARHRRKRKRLRQEVGRTKGGLTSKIHEVVDTLGNPLRIFLTAGNVNDTVPAGVLLADRAYDSNTVLEQARQQNMERVIPLENADNIIGSMTLMRTRSGILPNAFLQSSSLFVVLQPAMRN